MDPTRSRQPTRPTRERILRSDNNWNHGAPAHTRRPRTIFNFAQSSAARSTTKTLTLPRKSFSLKLFLCCTLHPATLPHKHFTPLSHPDFLRTSANASHRQSMEIIGPAISPAFRSALSNFLILPCVPIARHRRPQRPTAPSGPGSFPRFAHTLVGRASLRFHERVFFRAL